MPSKLHRAKANELQLLTAYDQQANSTPWQLIDYQASYHNPQHTILLSKIGNEIIGCIVVLQVLEQAEILQLWIKQTKQGQGYARNMLQQGRFWLHQRGCQQIFLEVLCTNDRAIKLYTKFGFKQVGVRKNYYLIKQIRYDGLSFLLEF